MNEIVLLIRSKAPVWERIKKFFNEGYEEIYYRRLTNLHQGLLYNKFIFKELRLYKTFYKLISDYTFFSLIRKIIVEFTYEKKLITKFRKRKYSVLKKFKNEKL